MKTNNTFNIKKVSNALGAKVENINLNDYISDATLNKIYNTFLKYQVVFF
jgi:alpha-ketoglutarate-dependent taurine dioxygenase